MRTLALLERVKETDCVVEGFNEIIYIFSGIVEVEASPCTRTGSQVPMERLGTMVT